MDTIGDIESIGHDTILVIGDPHYRVDNTYFTNKFHEVIDTHLQSTKYDFIVVLGDILDRHETVHLTPLRNITDTLMMLSRYAPTYVLQGNHDRLSDNDYMSNIHPLVGLQAAQLPNLHIISHTRRYGDYLFVPYVPKNRFREAMAAALDENGQPTNLTGIKMVFGHSEIRGAQLGAIVSEIDETWTPEDPPVISGHIHSYQRVHPNWIYVGTPFPHTYGEEARKSVSVVTVQRDNNPVMTDTGLVYSWTETRQHLTLPGRQLEHLSIPDIQRRLAEWERPVNMKLKWKIHGPRVEIQRLAKTEAYQALIRDVKIEYQYTDIVVAPKQARTEYRSYVDILRERLVNPLAQSYLDSLMASTQTVR